MAAYTKSRNDLNHSYIESPWIEESLKYCTLSFDFLSRFPLSYNYYTLNYNYFTYCLHGAGRNDFDVGKSCSRVFGRGWALKLRLFGP
jgi:hypothetical protein